jgi:lipopolysaccharide export system permease protein
VIDLFSHLDLILENKISFSLLKQYYLTFLPVIFVQISPFACLLATLYTFSKLNHDNEIIAMRSSGLSIFQITKTVIVFGLMMSFLIFWINDRVVPNSLGLNKSIKEQMEKGSKEKAAKGQQALNRITVFGSHNRLFFVNTFYPSNSTMEGVIILEHDEKQNIIKKIAADRGIYKKGLWRFYKSMTYYLDENGQMIGEPQFLEEEIMTITEPPQDFTNQRKTADYMNLSQLDEYIWRLSKSGATTVIRNLKVDYYQRFTSPMTSLIIILLGIPFALKIQKRSTGMSSLGISLVVGFLYYVLNAVSLALGKAGILAPFLAASLSHICALLFSTYLISTIP